MADTLSPEQRSALMARVRGKNTEPEMIVRRMLHRMGYRYRLHAKELPGKPDLVFRKRRLAIFVHGCFWHYHPDPNCPLARLPKSRLDFWRPKLEGNRARDSSNLDRLLSTGWRVKVVWECELRDIEQVENELRDLLKEVA